jgi:hypothetical protein
MTISLKPGDTVRATDCTEFACPFCKVRVVYGKMAGVSEGFAAVSHAFPMCEKFEANDGAEFVRLCLGELEKRIN